MAVIRGDKLSAEARSMVLRAYGYRWTIENQAKALRWWKQSKVRPPALAPTLTDKQWLAAHAFRVTQAGNLDRRCRVLLAASEAER